MRSRAVDEDELRLDAPLVRFDPRFLARLERFAALLGAELARREGLRSQAIVGPGAEFGGLRAYRAGEDVRRIDWTLLARLGRPYVRLTRREGGSTWLLLIDASASMGIGPPGKLQRVAEVALALAVLALRAGASVELAASTDPDARFGLARLARVREAAAWLESLRASGSRGLAALARDSPGRRADRVFALSDGFDVDPVELARLARPGRKLAALALLAPKELDPPREGAFAWTDPESGRVVALEVDAASRARYLDALGLRLERFRRVLASVGARFRVRSSADAFEDVARELVEPR